MRVLFFDSTLNFKGLLNSLVSKSCKVKLVDVLVIVLHVNVYDKSINN